MGNVTVKELRLIRNMTQDELSRETGLSVQTISAWETGRRRIGDLSRYKVAAYFGVDPDKIMTEVSHARDSEA